jgi:prevent-host-death family protein
MVYVGIKEFKSHLSQYVREVKRGGLVVVTDHGKPVARLMGENIDLSDKQKTMMDMVNKGLLILPKGDVDFKAKPVKSKGGLASDWILENRR